MLSFLRRTTLAVFIIAGLFSNAGAQDDISTFKSFQFSFNRVNNAWSTYLDTIRKAFTSKGLPYSGSNIFLRAFKSSNEMEVWARKDDTSAFVMIKNYRVCALSGALGPKRWEGDRQVPEGFYFIDDFNPKSDFHLSLLVSYPNYADLVQGNKIKPGGDIYIHGGCVTVGCLPMTDPQIQEIYTLCLNAKLGGQNYIPVHIYPTRFDRRGLNYLGREFAADAAKQKFWVNLKGGYDYFEKFHKLPPVVYTPDGQYVF